MSTTSSTSLSTSSSISTSSSTSISTTSTSSSVSTTSSTSTSTIIPLEYEVEEVPAIKPLEVRDDLKSLNVVEDVKPKSLEVGYEGEN